MAGFVQANTWSFSLLFGFLFFIVIASAFNHRSVSQVQDKTVSILAIVISLVCGLIVTLFAYVLTNLFIH